MVLIKTARPVSYIHMQNPSFYVHNECLLKRVSADYHFSYFTYLKKDLRGTLQTAQNAIKLR